MFPFKWLASATLTATILPRLHAEPHCPGNAAILCFRLVQRSQISVPVAINHTARTTFCVRFLGNKPARLSDMVPCHFSATFPDGRTKDG